MAKKKTFDESMERLEQIYEQMSSGDISLDESLKLYSEATALAKECYAILDGYEAKITELYASCKVQNTDSEE